MDLTGSQGSIQSCDFPNKYLSKCDYIFSQRKGFVLSGWITSHILAPSSQIQFYGIPLKRYLHPFTSVFPMES